MKVIGKYKICKDENLNKYKQLIELTYKADFDILVINNLEKSADLNKIDLEILVKHSKLNLCTIYILDPFYGLQLLEKNLNIYKPDIQYIIITKINIYEYLNNNLDSII